MMVTGAWWKKYLIHVPLLFFNTNLYNILLSLNFITHMNTANAIILEEDIFFNIHRY